MALLPQQQRIQVNGSWRRLDIINITSSTSFALQVANHLILRVPVLLPIPINPQYETTSDPPLLQQMDPLPTSSSKSLELKSDARRHHGNTRDPHPNCGDTGRVQTLVGTAGDIDGLFENVAAH